MGWTALFTKIVPVDVKGAAIRVCKRLIRDLGFTQQFRGHPLREGLGLLFIDGKLEEDFILGLNQRIRRILCQNRGIHFSFKRFGTCLLYTYDAADDL